MAVVIDCRGAMLSTRADQLRKEAGRTLQTWSSSEGSGHGCLECGVGFRQLRTCRRTRPGQLCAINVRFASQRTAAKFASLFDEAGGGVRDMTEIDRTGEHA